jgi:hydrogenase maturation protease
MDLAGTLSNCFSGRAVAVGIGNVALGDDGFGVRMAEELQAAGYPDVYVAGDTPENHVGPLTEKPFTHVLLLDAVETGAPAGSTLLMSAKELSSRFPQVSTHKISLGTLARLFEANGKTSVWLLGVQPKSLTGESLTPEVNTTLELLKRLWMNVYQKKRFAPHAEGTRI